MTDKERETVYNILSEYTNCSSQSISDSMDIANDLDLDSLDRMEIALFLEAELDIHVNDDKILACSKVYDIIEYIDFLLEEKRKNTI